MVGLRKSNIDKLENINMPDMQWLLSDERAGLFRFHNLYTCKRGSINMWITEETVLLQFEGL